MKHLERGDTLQHLKIGEKIKELRKGKGWSILQLSEISKVSTGMISQVERNLVVPTVVSLWNIAQALDTNISYFFDDEKKSDRFIMRKNDHKIIIMNKGKGIYELLSPDDKDHMLDFVKITLKGGQAYDNEGLSHQGEECGYVLSGVLTVQLNGKDYELSEGDSIYFNSHVSHRYLNLGEEDCVSIWSMTPRFF